MLQAQTRGEWLIPTVSAGQVITKIMTSGKAALMQVITHLTIMGMSMWILKTILIAVESIVLTMTFIIWAITARFIILFGTIDIG